MRGKRGIEAEMIGWIIIGVAVLAVVLIGYFILKNKGISAIDYIKNLFRLRR